MQYAIIKSGGKQYKISEGDILEVDRLSLAKDSTVSFDQVLLLVSDGLIKIGKPFIPNVKVEGKVVEEKKGEKIRVVKFKSKVRYRRAMGFRPLITLIKIEKIESIKKSKVTS